ncbi:hypothetical protein LZ575_18515 [Antarcticibacterium sp. 1MA-6-2]|uniref:hypothetical protein n=1 Tax=Antarcticibacterium sp. 1MA-6-2 TaxID=2908210 RepID=UPI001F16B0AC|nr:hypothetical protein [Antarcticibacterium sp. 1MA-6-2]UJH90731.1 hypothetical protein LZ575_18515 [Antarcticibacterium sp. 1MA-6-2]
MKKFNAINLLIIMMLFSFSYGQEKEGNIVEYFGKEKVEDVLEGDIIHIFKEGLMYSRRNFPTEPKSVLSDPIFARIIAKSESGITEGKSEGKDFKGEEVKWERIEVKENNEFNERRLGSGYLYLEYDSKVEQVVLFEASGHTTVLINGFPHEGDHYDFGWSLIPVKLKKGRNEFVLSGGRFSHMRARLLNTYKPVEFTSRDLTLPDLLIEEKSPLWGAIRVINMKDTWIKGGKILVEVGDASRETKIADILPMDVRKVPFSIPIPSNLEALESVEAILYLKDGRNKIIDTTKIELGVKSKYKHHKNTFLSDIDKSVQYYSLVPSLTKNKENQALFLSVHGASVEAVNQANAYKQKDWGHVVAPTNRRPFGFAWEDWGRLDAMEVLNHSEKLLETDPQQTYLTYYSMGGHGTWYLGATYPDRFAAIAPAAGYPDLLGYRQSRMSRMSEDQIQQYFEMTKAEFEERMSEDFSNAEEEQLDEIIKRAGNPSRTLKLENNYLHYGVYILHGDSDNVVPTYLAQEMRERLGQFHNDFAYYEYPGGEHWFGDESVDWPPIFYFFNLAKNKGRQ